MSNNAKFWLDQSGKFYPCSNHTQYAVDKILKLTNEEILELLNSDRTKMDFSRISSGTRTDYSRFKNDRNKLIASFEENLEVYGMMLQKGYVRVVVDTLSTPSAIYFDIGPKNDYKRFFTRKQLDALVSLAIEKELPLRDDRTFKIAYEPPKFDAPDSEMELAEGFYAGSTNYWIDPSGKFINIEGRGFPYSDHAVWAVMNVLSKYPDIIHSLGLTAEDVKDPTTIYERLGGNTKVYVWMLTKKYLRAFLSNISGKPTLTLDLGDVEHSRQYLKYIKYALPSIEREAINKEWVVTVDHIDKVIYNPPEAPEI